MLSPKICFNTFDILMNIIVHLTLFLERGTRLRVIPGNLEHFKNPSCIFEYFSCYLPPFVSQFIRF